MLFGALFAKTWRISQIFMRKEMSVVRITDGNLAGRLAFGLALELVFLGIIEVVDPITAISAVQSALPRDQTIYFCAPSTPELAASLSVYKGLMLLFGALMSFSTRSVSNHSPEDLLVD